jgi:glycosyltransferase involved in cell wall biosynthesis
MTQRLIYTLANNAALPKFDKSVSLLCWAYNEEILIEGFLRRIHGLLEASCEKFEIVLVDDCSTDRTNEIAWGLQKEIPQLRIVRNEKNVNVGYSCRRAIGEARMEYLFWQTIDWSYDIEMLRTFLELLKEHDIVAGVRRRPVAVKSKIAKPFYGLASLFHIKHLTKRSDTISKAFISICNYALIRLLFGVPLSDFQNIVFYPSRLVQSHGLQGKSSFLNPELLIKSHWLGASIVEVPISFLPRQAGVAKGTRIKAIMSSTGDVFGNWYKWRVKGLCPRDGQGRITRLNPNEWEVI